MKRVKKAFDDINKRLRERLGDKAYLKHCQIAEKDHLKRERWFAHTNHLQDTVCVCSALELLPEKRIYGILAHEFGHILAFRYLDDYTEEGANYCSRYFLDVPIRYTGKLDLQETTQQAISLLKKGK